MPISTPRLVRAFAASLAPVPPSAIARSVMPVIVPLVIVRLVRVAPSESRTASVPRPSVVRWAAASASSRIARPAAVQLISSTMPCPAEKRPRMRSWFTFWILTKVIPLSANAAVPSFVALAWFSFDKSIELSARVENCAVARSLTVIFLVSAPLRSTIARTSFAEVPAAESAVSCVIRWSAKARTPDAKTCVVSV